MINLSNVTSAFSVYEVNENSSSLGTQQKKTHKAPIPVLSNDLINSSIKLINFEQWARLQRVCHKERASVSIIFHKEFQ